MVPVCLVQSTRRPENQVLEIAPANPNLQIITIDLELEEAFQQRRRALQHENHSNHVIENLENEEIVPVHSGPE